MAPALAHVLVLVKKGVTQYVQGDVTRVVWVLAKNIANIHARVIVRGHVAVLLWEAQTEVEVQTLVGPLVMTVAVVAKTLVQVGVNKHVKEVARKLVRRLVRGYVIVVAKELAHLIVLENVIKGVRGVAIKGVMLHAKDDARERVLEHAPGVAGEIVTVLVLGLCSSIDNTYSSMIKSQQAQWRNGLAKNITFIVTKDCQLACKYCYLVGKNEKERMPFSIAKQAIDYILSHEEEFTEESVVWDFIGGEPFLEIDLIDKICDYIKEELYRRHHHWFNSYRFSFSTNGINYDHPKVQEFISKNLTHLSIGITIDGTKRKHDLNRIWKKVSDEEPDRGSYDYVVRNIPLWLSQFPNGATKVTISSEDIPYIVESVLHLFSLGIHEVNINCVFEDVWKDGDDVTFENQLTDLADAIIDQGLYENNGCSFFSENIGKPLNKVLDNHNWCGAGKMLAIDAAGNFYPCTRFAAYSLRAKRPIIIGNIRDGIITDKLRPFLTLDRLTQSSQECIDCEVASGCAWCQGENYDAAVTDTIFQRSTAICKMHKARVRANNYYWNKLFKKLEEEGLRDEYGKKKKTIT